MCRSSASMEMFSVGPGSIEVCNKDFMAEIRGSATTGGSILFPVTTASMESSYKICIDLWKDCCCPHPTFFSLSYSGSSFGNSPPSRIHLSIEREELFCGQPANKYRRWVISNIPTNALDHPEQRVRHAKSMQNVFG